MNVNMALDDFDTKRKKEKIAMGVETKCDGFWLEVSEKTIRSLELIEKLAVSINANIFYGFVDFNWGQVKFEGEIG